LTIKPTLKLTSFSRYVESKVPAFMGKTLGVTPENTDNEIKRAYRKLMSQ